MDRILAFLSFAVALAVMFIAFPDGPLAVLFGSVCALIVFFLIGKNFEAEEKVFLRRTFLTALLLRVGLATVTYVFRLQEFFGGDSIIYDNTGYALYNWWLGNYREVVQAHFIYIEKATGSGFGMFYLVAAIYLILGRNPFAIQLFNSVLGAATACLIYICVKNIFNNKRAARTAAILVAVFPSLVLWSSQGLKDGIICFLLALAINTLFSLHKKLHYADVLILLVSLVGIYTLRFYIFYAFVVTILGSFVFSSQKSITSIARQIVVLVVVTLGLTYLGVLRNAQENLENYGNLEQLQSSRLDASRAGSGFGEDIDVSTPAGALEALPIGLVYIMLAPFPWQVSNFRQAITLPEVFIWWALIPFLAVGIWYTFKNKLRDSVAVILLTLLLTVSYAIFQGNVGTAYRMRAQMQIFYFIFIAVGLTIWQEKRENQIFVRKNLNRQIKTT